MKSGYLSEYFSGVWTKTLTKVDATTHSNQHEIGDTDSDGTLLKKILGDQPRKGNNRLSARYIWLQDEQETISEQGFLSWYDTREKQAHRAPEWRLYYQTNTITEYMTEGDRLYVARQKDGSVLFIVVPSDSSLGNQVAWLFGLSDQASLDFAAREIDPDDDTSILDFLSRFILDEMGIEFEDPNANALDTIVERFGFKFPKTAEFSALARQTLPESDEAARDDPDSALMAWLNHEEALFRRLERKIVSRRLEEGFRTDDGMDVDEFIRYSLGVQNRRKSRMGHSFENHLKAIFDANELSYASQLITEKGKKPDFVFPGGPQYFDKTFSVDLLTMLAAKSTCKDRWPQVLPEAERIPQKHLVTLEPGISESQTQTMKASGVQLVVPSSLQVSYTNTQRSWLFAVSDFVDLVRTRQDFL